MKNNKKSYIKQILMIISFVTLSVGITGCVQEESIKEDDTQNINYIALEYMEQKYGEPFEYVAPWGNSMTDNHELIVKCNSLANQDIVIKVSNYKDDDKIFQDNYLAVKYYEETIEFLKQCTNEFFGDSKIGYNVAKYTLSPNLPAGASFNEYFADEEVFISACIAVKESSFATKEQGENVMKPILSACGGRYLSILLIVIDDAEYESLDVDTLREKVVSRQFIHCARLTREDNDIEFEWLENN